MVCPECGSENVTIEIAQTGGKGKKSSVGLGGHINNAARAVTAVSTLGMSNLVWKKAKAESKTTFENKKVCLCQNCGNSWVLKGKIK